MKTGANGLSLIKHFEQCRLVAFKPIPTDPWTLGWGRAYGVKDGDTCTQEEADAMLAEDVEEAAAGVRKLALLPISQNAFDALVSFAYNVGTDIDADLKAEGLGDSTLLKYVNAGRFDAAAGEFPKWNKSAGRVLNGLTIRREAERRLFLTPDGQPFKVNA